VPLTTRSAVVLLACLLFACALRNAQAAGPSVPSAGFMLQQMQPALPAGAAASDVHLTAPEQPDTPVPSGIAFRVTAIEITGNTRIATDQLHALVQDAEGQDLTLAALTEVVARITALYHRQGFPLARAIVPGQTMVAGVLQIQVIEARYDAVVLDNQTTLNDALLRSAFKPLQSGQVIQQATLDRALLWLSDIPGVVVNATMKPGSHAGATDLEVTTTAPSTGVTGNSVIDNYGNAYVGRSRVSQSLRVTDPFKQRSGAALDLNGLSSGSGLTYGRVAYETVLSGAATRVGGAYSALQYTLGGPVAASGSQGDAQVGQLWLRRSLLRSYTANLSVQLQYDKTQLRDHSGIDIDNNRHTDKITASLSGDVQDGLWLGGVNNWNLSLANGVVSFDNAAAQLANAGQSEGRFSKVNSSFSRLQKLNQADSLYAALTLQWASRNLDSSEKMALGGASSVRAADASALSGDMGALLNLEYRHSLGTAWGGFWQLTGFMDSAAVRLNQTALGTHENRAQMSGAGIGLVWSGPQQFFVKAQLARVLGTPSASLAGVTGSVRGWLEIAHAF
jgi:hemolysin activation/secretion protein